MSYLMAIFLGLVQGLAEFLPISSSGHLSLFQNLFGLDYNESDHMLFNVMLHLGTLATVLFVYRKDIISMVKDTLRFITSGGKEGKDEKGRLVPSVRNVLFLIVATLPLVIVLPFYDKIEVLNYSTAFIAIALLVTGTLLFVSDKLEQGKKTERTYTALDALIIGLGQCVATLPGISRSGTTITVGIARGLKRDFAVRFSFLLSIPAVLGSFLLEIIDVIKTGVEWALVPKYLVGMIVSAVSGYFAIKLVNKIVSKTKFGYFAYYCWGAGAIALIVSLFK